jgi:hypothetical protein
VLLPGREVESHLASLISKTEGSVVSGSENDSHYHLTSAHDHHQRESYDDRASRISSITLPTFAAPPPNGGGGDGDADHASRVSSLTALSIAAPPVGGGDHLPAAGLGALGLDDNLEHRRATTEDEDEEEYDDGRSNSSTGLTAACLEIIERSTMDFESDDAASELAARGRAASARPGRP